MRHNSKGYNTFAVALVVTLSLAVTFCVTGCGGGADGAAEGETTINKIDEKFDDIKKIYLEVNSADVKFINGDEFNVTGEYAGSAKINIKEDSGELVIKEDVKSSASEGDHIIIQCPKSTLEKITVNMDLGNLDIRNIDSAIIDIENKSGKVEISDSSSENLSLFIDSGDCKLKNIKTDNIAFDCNSGNLNMEQLDTQKISGYSETGNITVEGKIHEGTYIEDGSGNVELILDGEKDDYGYKLTSGSGKVNFDGKSKEGTLSHKPSAKKQIVVIASVGDVNVQFK